MSSPVQIPFKSFIQIDKNLSTSVYLQIVHGFIKAIQLGYLPEGTKLPGTRILCKIFEVNRNTLIKSFEDLQAQGWIEIIPNKGTFILSNQKQKVQSSKSPACRQTGKFRSPKPEVKSKLSNSGFPFLKSTILENPIEKSSVLLQFNEGLPDMRLAETEVLSKIYLSKLKNQNHKKSWEQLANESSDYFKTQLVNYLNLTRGIHISKPNLLPTNSNEMSLYLTVKLLISPDDKVVVANLSYYASNMVFLNAGSKIIPIPVDKNGISTKHLKQVCKEQNIRMLYLTSHHHYPTTVSLSAKRRMEVLELANQYGFIILEDDYDYDFHYDNNPMLPLKSFDTNGMVVYIGSFGKSLASGFRTGFIVAQSDLIDELHKHQQILEPDKDIIKEQVLGYWIEEGEMHRYLKKVKKIYKERRDYFSELLNKNLKGKISFEVPSGGLAFWVEWKNNLNLGKLKKECEKNGLFLPQTILYQNKNITATRIGFGHLNFEEMEKAAGFLKNSTDNLYANKNYD